MRFASRGAATLFMAGLLGGCSLAPPYKVPQSTPVPSAFEEQQSAWQPAHPMDTVPRGDWWQIFGDPQLDALESKVGEANQNLKAAFARLLQARAETRIARADLFPSITAAASAQRARISPNSPNYLPGKPTMGSDFNVEADLSYEVDLWGRVRNQVASAKANQQASAADLASLELSIRAEVASDYFDLRGDDLQLLLLDQAVADYEQSLRLTKNLYTGGAVPLADVAQAETQLENARTQAADMRLQRSRLQHAVALLIGENPSGYSLPANPLPSDLAPPALDPGVPSALIERRPDVAEAERRVASANAQIGVARAAYFPQFTLSADAGLNSVHSYNWLSAPSRFWSVGPQLSVPLFEGGRLLAQTDRAKALYMEQVANYRSTVLAAFQDVEDSLVALRELAQEAETAGRAVTAAQTSLQQAQYRYTAGAVTYLDVSSAETAALQAQLSAVSIEARRMDAAVLLIKALGGGWQAASGAPVKS
jgi:NodT family efflux transporter outer membrane factor (OMF) lipoprotein